MNKTIENPTAIQLVRLMQEQNQLIQQQNALLQQILSQEQSFGEDLLLPGEKIFVEDLFRDEIREGFVVTAQRKRLWNVQLNIVAEVARICEKHNIRWFAYAGTLLGAVRHKGFIPWDDDIDISMLRPDYERFKQVIKTEINEPYFVDAWYDYKLEEEDPDILQAKSFLQVVKRDQKKKYLGCWPFWPMIKIKDSRTACIQYLERQHVHQGIWIDIFPLDPVPPFSNRQDEINFEIQRELLFAMALPEVITNALRENPSSVLLDRNELKNIMGLPHKEKANIIDSFALENFLPDGFVGETRDFCIVDRRRTYALKDFEDTIYLPFEKTELPAPSGFENCLNAGFGDWHKLVFAPQHAKVYSANFSYKDFFDNVKFV